MFQNWNLKGSATIVFIAIAIAIPAMAQPGGTPKSRKFDAGKFVINEAAYEHDAYKENNPAATCDKENSSDDSASSMDVETPSSSQEKKPLEDITNTQTTTVLCRGYVKVTPFTEKTLKRVAEEKNSNPANPDMIYALVFPSEQKLNQADEAAFEFDNLPRRLRFDMRGRSITDIDVFHELVAALWQIRDWLIENDMLVYVGETARLARQYEHTSRMNSEEYQTREYRALRAILERLVEMAQLAQSDSNVVIPFQGFVLNVREEERHVLEGLVIYILRANFDRGVNSNSGAQDLVRLYIALYQAILEQGGQELATVTIPNALTLAVALPDGRTSHGMAVLPGSVGVSNCVYSLSNMQIPLTPEERVDLGRELGKGGSLYKTTFGALFEFLAKRFGTHREFVLNNKVSAYFGQTKRLLELRALEEAEAVSTAPGRRVSMGIVDTLLAGGVVLDMHWVHAIADSLLKVVEAFMIDFFQTDQGCRGWNSLPGSRKDFDDDDNLPEQGNIKRPRLRLF